MVRLTDRPDMTLDVYRGRKKKQCNNVLYLYQVLSKYLIGFPIYGPEQ